MVLELCREDRRGTVVQPDYGLWLCLSTRLTPTGGETWTRGRAVRHRFELEGAGTRVRMVSVVSLVVNSVGHGGLFSAGFEWVLQQGCCCCSVACVGSVVPGWLVLVVLLMMDSLVGVFLVWRTVADRSGAVPLVVVGCIFCCMCSMVAKGACLLGVPFTNAGLLSAVWLPLGCVVQWLLGHVASPVSELWVPCVPLSRHCCSDLAYALCVLVMSLVVCCVTCCVCLVALCCLIVSSGEVFPELFLACFGGGFSQNFFVLVSVLLPSGLRCVVGWLCVLVRFPKTVCCCLGEGFSQDCSVLVSGCCRATSGVEVCCWLAGAFWWVLPERCLGRSGGGFSHNCLVLLLLAAVLSLKFCVDWLFRFFVPVEFS
ncbi:hypothetical protein Taro_056752 [Colocasia esculenta]|uniref:Uncharacterized protein n=1 Tax=Colocasia esculenta TaxID=4460 RepID=A0A843XYC7_COLES|nr:hypothetical protein [Colocasia esculenta]